MSVRYSYLQEQFREPDEIFNEIRKLLKTGDFTLGPQVAQFEKKFAELIGSKYAIGVGSGTDAIKLSLRAAGVKGGDEVITTANTFIATVGAINEVGGRTRFVDCTENYVMDVAKLEAAVTPRTKAIVPVHFTGEPVDMDQVMYVAKKYKLEVIEDACQSILCRYKGRTCGTFGIAGAFSLHPLKNLNVWADGGIIVTDDTELDRTLRLLRNHGLKNRDEIELLGYNSRLDSIQAIVGNWLIPQTRSITKRRQENAAYYDRAFMDMADITLPPKRANCERVYHIYMFQVGPQHRNRLYQHLLRNGIEAKIHYPIPLYQQEGLRKLRYPPGSFPVTDAQAKRVISLPVDQHLSRAQQDFCILKVKEYFEAL